MALGSANISFVACINPSSLDCRRIEIADGSYIALALWRRVKSLVLALSGDCQTLARLQNIRSKEAMKRLSLSTTRDFPQVWPWRRFGAVI